MTKIKFQTQWNTLLSMSKNERQTYIIEKGKEMNFTYTQKCPLYLKNIRRILTQYKKIGKSVEYRKFTFKIK